MSSRNGEFELEGELEGEFEFEGEGEFELEGEGEFEFEGEGESEFEGEGELEFEAEGEYEGEFEGEQFFRRLRRIGRGIGGFVRRAAPVLRSVARVAAPLFENGECVACLHIAGPSDRFKQNLEELKKQVGQCAAKASAALDAQAAVSVNAEPERRRRSARTA